MALLTNTVNLLHLEGLYAEHDDLLPIAKVNNASPRWPIFEVIAMSMPLAFGKAENAIAENSTAAAPRAPDLDLAKNHADTNFVCGTAK
ncbi:hypothetical protein [Arcanobacterium haemolyticum]|uniref:Uncharacterized protein n=1 Tax=Arcanobacterium haemolyticum (strain ATCC 9345 / DSM 20595 / CCM 5947 / CCUG 17215 / LMG 16163 / NBRC 15585 / NCTC 8452 / 11018) TaxID=644284 RepID=D7BMU9_ARCHD|nr:hypothetical protein [Arcanobacterium haemolyticum]ADH92248.1 hypothetical protein Arch_0500 [Arcanobacterium haemolyticum DSM 20595]SQH29041.1 Uncharacterised protein [Arcanobacterium haemolyticum]